MEAPPLGAGLADRVLEQAGRGGGASAAGRHHRTAQAAIGAGYPH